MYVLLVQSHLYTYCVLYYSVLGNIFLFWMVHCGYSSAGLLSCSLDVVFWKTINFRVSKRFGFRCSHCYRNSRPTMYMSLWYACYYAFLVAIRRESLNLNIPITATVDFGTVAHMMFSTPTFRKHLLKTSAYRNQKRIIINPAAISKTSKNTHKLRRRTCMM